MILAEFEDLLKRTIGLDTASVGSSVVVHAVQARMSACDLDDWQAYLEHVRASQTELQELVEAVVIPETWFFRDREAFVAMTRMANEEWLANHAQGVFRLLSLPCSTGEEPYSMAMALLDSGFPADRFRIDAVDISARALARAERGVYGKNSFRGSEHGFLDRHFARTTHGYQLAEAVSRHVQFKQGNLFSFHLPQSGETYDIIFCRSLLIYFDRAAQERAIGLLNRMLTANGLLCVGPSETSLLLRRDFYSARIPLAFAFRKVTAVPPASKRPIEHLAKPGHQAPPIAALAPGPASGCVAKLRVASQRRLAVNHKAGIEDIRRLADQGQLAEAASRCEDHLRDNDPSPEVLHLLGLIRDAAGNLPEAAEYYRKALYLDPNHHQALVHLALLLEKQGNKGGAKVLNERLRRLDRQEGKQHA